MRASVNRREAEVMAMEEIGKHGGSLAINVFDPSCECSHRFYELLGQMADEGKIGQKRKDRGLTTVFYLLEGSRQSSRAS